MPKLGTMAGTGPVVPEQEMSGLMGTARKAIADMGSAAALREMLSGLGAAGGKTNSADSSVLGGVGQLIGGLGTAFKGMSETQTALFSSLLGKGQGGGGDQNQMLMFLLLMQVMKDSGETKESAMATVLQQTNSMWQTMYQDLQNRSGPSQADSVTQQLTAQMLAETMQRLRQPPADPVDVLVDARERLQKLGVNGGGLFGQPYQYSDGYLKNRQLDIELQRVIAAHSAEQTKAQSSANLAGTVLEHGPKILQTAIEGAIQTLAAAGKLPGVQVVRQAPAQVAAPQQDSPQAVAEAEAAMKRAGAA